MGALVHQQWEEKTKSISAGVDERCEPKWFSFTSLGPLDPVAHEELIGAYNLTPASVRIKSNLIKIPHL